MRQFKKVIHIFGEFKILSKNMICLDEEIRRKFKLRNFNKVFQITKRENFEIHSKKKEIEIPQVVELLIG